MTSRGPSGGRMHNEGQSPRIHVIPMSAAWRELNVHPMVSVFFLVVICRLHGGVPTEVFLNG
jgi:hypothetical protein